MGEFMKVVTVKHAVDLLRSSLPERKMSTVSLTDSLHKELAEPIASPESIPAFTRSTVDGYGVKAQDTFGCSESLPSFLSYRGEVHMGREPDFTLGGGECAWIPTGGMLPMGCDSVVMVEYTERLADDTVLIYKPIGPGENTMQQGEDAPAGSLLLEKNHRLRPQDIGLLASVGISQVPVFCPWRVGIISTGNEIVSMDTQPAPGQVRDVNSWSLAAAVHSAGGIAKIYSIVSDDVDRLKEAVADGLRENDWLLISGGSSVGIMDVTLDVLMSFPDASLLFHGLAVKPGKPTMTVTIGSQMVIGLPGHPVSALTIFNILAGPLLRGGLTPQLSAILEVNVASQPGRDDYIPVILSARDEKVWARPLLGKSGLMTTLAHADGYIHIDYERQGILGGEAVLVTLFD